jgi:hypothetical protein
LPSQGARQPEDDKRIDPMEETDRCDGATDPGEDDLDRDGDRNSDREKNPSPPAFLVPELLGRVEAAVRSRADLDDDGQEKERDPVPLDRSKSLYAACLRSRGTRESKREDGWS